MSFAPHRCFLCATAALLCASAALPAAAPSWTPLFDGRTLDGFFTKPGGTWEVVDGAIHGTSSKDEKRHGILVTEERFSDFRLKLEFKILAGDSGVYFRARPADQVVGVLGYQAEVDTSPGETGGIYDTGTQPRRGWIFKAPPEKVEKALRPGEWNTLEIRASGDHIQTWLNDTPIADLHDSLGAGEGHIGLQLHGGQDMDVYYRNIVIAEEDASVDSPK
ncbi:MAG: 3-keto-disaccharide hydrolase [Opitutaceae bacterium]